MIPCLYDAYETKFEHNGIGKLSDCQSCLVTEKRNGSYECKMEYPSEGIHADDLKEGNIILCKCSDCGQTQPFRIYKITTPLSGQLTVQARHISYQLNFVTVSPCTASGPEEAMNTLLKNATVPCPFVLQIDFTSTAGYKLTKPAALRSCLGGMEGSMIDTYGGELEWDRHVVTLHHARGMNHGVRIVYGKNLIDFKMEKSIENVITGIHPYWVDSETNMVLELPEKVVTLANAKAPYAKIVTRDFTESFESQPTVAKLRSAAKSYLKTTTMTEPDIDITVDFTKLSKTPGYEEIAEAEDVSLCDTVHVYISRLGIEVSSKVTETVYDSLLERYHSITLSNSLTSSRNRSLTTSLSDIKAEAVAAVEIASSASVVASEQTIAAAKKMVEEQLLTYDQKLGSTYVSKTESEQTEKNIKDAAKKYTDDQIAEKISGLEGTYQTTADMEAVYKRWLGSIAEQYVTKESLDSYITNDALSTALEGYAKTENLAGFVSGDALADFVKTEQLTDFIKQSDLEELLQGYQTQSDIEALLGDYLKQSDLDGYLTQTVFTEWQEGIASSYVSQETYEQKMQELQQTIENLQQEIKALKGGEEG